MYMPWGFQKCIWEPWVTTSKYHNKNFAHPCISNVKFGCCNLEFPFIFLGHSGIPQYCSVLGFLVTWHALPYRGFKRPVLRTGRGMEWMVVFDRNMIIFVLVDNDTRQKMVYRVIISTEMKFLSAISCLADAKIVDIRSTPIIGRTLVDGNNKGKEEKAATTGMCSGGFQDR